MPQLKSLGLFMSPDFGELKVVRRMCQPLKKLSFYACIGSRVQVSEWAWFNTYELIFNGDVGVSFLTNWSFMANFPKISFTDFAEYF